MRRTARPAATAAATASTAAAPRRGRLLAAALSGAVGVGLAFAPLAPTSAAPVSARPGTPALERPGPDGIRDGQLDRLIQRVRDLGAIGVVGEVRTPDGVWRGAAGAAVRDPRRAARPADRFRAASVSKMIVTVLALQQVERGRWSLDTTLGDVLPQLWPERSNTTLRQLLSHTSGIPEYLAALTQDATTTEAFLETISEPRTDTELVGAAKTLPVVAEPGEFSYANTNFVIVGMMLEEATGLPLGELVERRVLRPAQMTRSSWPTTARTPRATLHEYARLYGEVADLSSFEPSMFSGAGALLTTARDLDRFQLALSTGRLVERDLVRQMRSVTSDGGEVGLAYGLGSYRVPDPCRPGRFLHGHDGGSWGTLTLSYASPRGERRATVSMTGRDYDGDVAALTALNELVVVALAQTCGGVPVSAGENPGDIPGEKTPPMAVRPLTLG